MHIFYRKEVWQSVLKETTRCLKEQQWNIPVLFPEVIGYKEVGKSITVWIAPGASPTVVKIIKTIFCTNVLKLIAYILSNQVLW